MVLNNEEIKAVLLFLNRVQLQGQEAETLVMLKQKLQQMLQTPEPTGEVTNGTS